MDRFADLSLSAFLDALASPDPTPGGGTAAAVTGAMGTSLLMMVAALAKTRTGTDAERTALQTARPGLDDVRQRLIGLADTDTAAYNEVTAAYRLARSTDDEKTVRREAIQRAMRAATEAPLDTLRAVIDGLSYARVVAQHGNRSASSDVRVAVELLEAAAGGATANIEINLTSLDDEGYRRATAGTVMDLNTRLLKDAADIRTALP